MKQKIRKDNKKSMSNDTNINKQMQSSSGITLIALVTAVIILIILATMSLRSMFGDNGLLTKVENTKNETGQDLTNSQEYIDKSKQEFLNATTF